MQRNQIEQFTKRHKHVFNIPTSLGMICLCGKRQKKNKYMAKRVKCLSKHDHDSMREADVCNGLLAELRKNKISGYKVHVPFALFVNNTEICTVEIDFLVWKCSDETQFPSWEFLEVKSEATKTKDWKIKWKLLGALYPHIKQTVIE